MLSFTIGRKKYGGVDDWLLKRVKVGEKLNTRLT